MAETRRGSGNAATAARVWPDPATPDAPFCHEKEMTGAIDTIAGRLIEAAYEFAPDPGGEYIAAVTREIDVPAYFRETIELVREPRATWERCSRFL